MERTIKGLLFDLDGVLVDTAKYHYLAWKQLAEKLGLAFDRQVNERLKGVSRMASLEIILETNQRAMTMEEKEARCAEKNEIYLGYIRQLQEEELFPGVREFLTDARAKGYRTALGSASRNSMLILERLKIKDLFDAIVDGTQVTKTKPAPEVFLAGAQALGVEPTACIVFEDATAGVEAAHRAGMLAVGIGDRESLPEADIVTPGLEGLTADDVVACLQEAMDGE